jgi:hypothetical protein
LGIPFLFVLLDKGVVVKGATSCVSNIFKDKTFLAMEALFKEISSNSSVDEDEVVTLECLHKVSFLILYNS